MPATLKELLSPPAVWRGLKKRLADRAIVLLYHKIHDGPADPCLLQVRPSRFEQHLQVIHKLCRPMDVAELSRRLRSGQVPHRAVCVTFDDAYVDNLLEAKPLLERYQVPATMFATTGAAGRAREFWWDQIERIFLQPGRLPRRLRMKLDSCEIDCDLGTACEWDHSEAAAHNGWNLEQDSTPTPRHSMFREFHGLLQPMHECARQAALEELMRWAGRDGAEVRPACRALDMAELVELERGGLIEIGAHSVNHPQLNTASRVTQQREIADSKLQLERALGHAVAGFAYPYGLWSETTVEIAREAGLEYACTCIATPVWRSSDLYLLPRLQVTDCDGDAFEKLMRHWLGWR